MKIATSAYPLDFLASWADYAAKIEGWVAEAAGNGAELLLFPEYGAMELTTLAGAETAAHEENSMIAVSDRMDDANALHADLATKYSAAEDVLFLGRGLSFPMALEGALKLKEISYVHAEGYAAGEMKHGPIALLDSDVPVIVLAPQDRHYERVCSNLQEARARDAQIIGITTDGDGQAQSLCHDYVEVAPTLEALTPFLTVVPLQLYAYCVADHKGTDVDQPRNLAKSVTVE